jgi:hypothetical protein
MSAPPCSGKLTIVYQFPSKFPHANRSLLHANRVSDRAFSAHRETDFGRQRRMAPNRLLTVFVSYRDREPTNTAAPSRGKSRVSRRDEENSGSAGHSYRPYDWGAFGGSGRFRRVSTSPRAMILQLGSRSNGQRMRRSWSPHHQRVNGAAFPLGMRSQAGKFAA